METELTIIPLSVAMLCANCGVISNAKNGHCPFCAGSGESLVNLANVLNRADAPRRTE